MSEAALDLWLCPVVVLRVSQHPFARRAMTLPINSHDQTGFGVTERMLLATPAANRSAPALAPPRGVIPNFENPPNGNTTASVAFIVMMVVSTLCLVVRAYGKLYPRRMVYFEDGKSAIP